MNLSHFMSDFVVNILFQFSFQTKIFVQKSEVISLEVSFSRTVGAFQR